LANVFDHRKGLVVQLIDRVRVHPPLIEPGPSWRMMIDHYAGGHPSDVMTGCHHVLPRPVFDLPLPLSVVGFGIEIDSLNSM
jgi:hypothetical protein